MNIDSEEREPFLAALRSLTEGNPDLDAMKTVIDSADDLPIASRSKISHRVKGITALDFRYITVENFSVFKILGGVIGIMHAPKLELEMQNGASREIFILAYDPNVLEPSAFCRLMLTCMIVKKTYLRFFEVSKKAINTDFDYLFGGLNNRDQNIILTFLSSLLLY
jgi:hypothetical protein